MPGSSMRPDPKDLSGTGDGCRIDGRRSSTERAGTPVAPTTGFADDHWRLCWRMKPARWNEWCPMTGGWRLTTY